MFSIRHTFRKAIIAISLFSLTTTIPAGCSDKNAVSGEAVTATSNTSHKSEEATAESESNTFSIKYKYWYDNQDVQEAQEQTFQDNDPGGDDNGTTFLDLAGLPIYTDASGNEYIISGRSIVYLKDGKIPENDMHRLRSETNGNKYYMMAPAGALESIAAVKEKIAASDKKQPETFDERVANGTPAEEIEGTVAVYMNNTDTGTFFNSSDPRVMISELITAYDLGSLAVEGNTAVLTLNTGAGDVTLTFEFSDTDCKLTYSTGLKEQKIGNTEVSLGDGKIFMSLTAIEDYLGYDVEYYKDFINIVTDNKDIITEDSALPSDAWFSMIKEASEEVTEPEPAETQAKPSNNKTPDGKYTLADSDIINKDGTYTQKLGTGDPSDVSVPKACTDFNAAWTAEFASSCHGQSNPSKIPYSDITLENAAEAFPYLGYIGHVPDYLEIMPGDNQDLIMLKIFNNLVGTSCQDFYGYYPEEPADADKEDHPTHFFSSEAEYNAFHEERMRIADEAEAAAKRAQEDIDAGNWRFDEGTPKENQELADYFESLGF